MENVAIFPNIEQAKYVAPVKVKLSPRAIIEREACRAVWDAETKLTAKLRKENAKLVRQLEKLSAKLDANTREIEKIEEASRNVRYCIG